MSEIKFYTQKLSEQCTEVHTGGGCCGETKTMYMCPDGGVANDGGPDASFPPDANYIPDGSTTVMEDGGPDANFPPDANYIPDGGPTITEDGGTDGGTTVTEDGGVCSGTRSVLIGTDPTKTLIKGGILVTVGEEMDGGSKAVSIIRGAQVLVIDKLIKCVSSSDQNTCEATADAAGATKIQLGQCDKIYPAFINMHDHPDYSPCPMFEHPDKLYTHQAQWANGNEYKLWKKQYLYPNQDNSLDKCQNRLFGLGVSLMGGAGSLQGISTSPYVCLKKSSTEPLLGRMIDTVDGLRRSDEVRTNVIGPDGIEPDAGVSLCRQMEGGTVKRYIIHMGEATQGEPHGIAQFDTFMDLGSPAGCLLNNTLVNIHGNAYGKSGIVDAHGNDILNQFVAAGAMIVWSPSSQTDLYGWSSTASSYIPDLLYLGIPVSLAPDWTASGGSGMVTEINKAKAYAKDFFPAGSLTDEMVFRMVTVNAAHAAGLEQYIGKILPGMQADITILTGHSGDPYEPEYLGDVAMVMVGGSIYYGDRDMMAASRIKRGNDQGACDDLSICGVEKTICIPQNLDGEVTSFKELQNNTFVYLPDPSNTADESRWVPPLPDTLPNACRP